MESALRLLLITLTISVSAACSKMASSFGSESPTTDLFPDDNGFPGNGIGDDGTGDLTGGSGGSGSSGNTNSQISNGNNSADNEAARIAAEAAEAARIAAQAEAARIAAERAEAARVEAARVAAEQAALAARTPTVAAGQPNVVLNATFTELATHAPWCSWSTPKSIYCLRGANRFCQARGYAAAYGPIEYYLDDLTVICMSSHGMTSLVVPTPNFRKIVPTCYPHYDPFTLDCAAAANAVCGGNGQGGSFGIIATDDSQITVGCIKPPNAKSVVISVDELTRHHEYCDSAMSPGPCQSATTRLCHALDPSVYVGGYGPVGHDAANNLARVDCIKR